MIDPKYRIVGPVLGPDVVHWPFPEVAPCSCRWTYGRPSPQHHDSRCASLPPLQGPPLCCWGQDRGHVALCSTQVGTQRNDDAAWARDNLEPEWAGPFEYDVEDLDPRTGRRSKPMPEY